MRGTEVYDEGYRGIRRGVDTCGWREREMQSAERDNDAVFRISDLEKNGDRGFELTEFRVSGGEGDDREEGGGQGRV